MSADGGQTGLAVHHALHEATGAGGEAKLFLPRRHRLHSVRLVLLPLDNNRDNNIASLSCLTVVVPTLASKALTRILQGDGDNAGDNIISNRRAPSRRCSARGSQRQSASDGTGC
jgi:hypothetical protein